MAGSGFEDVVIEAGVCASGSIEKVMNGKHYNRALRVHQRMADALERLLIEAFLENTSTDSSDINPTTIPEMSDLASSPCSDNLQSVLNSDQCQGLLSRYEKWKCDVRAGKLGRTAQFWLKYSDCVMTLMRFQQSIKLNDLSLYIETMRALCNLIFSADHLHYARYLPLFTFQLFNLSSTHPGAEQLLANCGFSVSRSAVPCCRNPIDLTIEQTINRSAKTRGGISGFSRKADTYFRWCLNRHARAMYAEATFDRADMSDNSSDAHKTTRPSEIRKSETDVLKLVTAFKQFLNPFNIDDHNKDKLFSLSSGKPASAKVQENLLNYVDTGERAAESFIQKRLVEKTIKFQDPMKKLNLHTFNSMAVVKSLSSSKKKTIQIKAERNLLGRLLLLSQENDISLEKLFKYPLSPIPWSLATADGGLVKTDKSKLMHHLESLVPAAVSPTLENCTYIIDGNALFQSLVHLPETFEDLAFQIFASLPKSEIVHFVTDTYKPDSIKGLERTRRGSATTYNIAGGAKIKLPRDFKSFLLNSENKKQLIHLVLMQWHTTRYASLLHHRKVFYAAEESCNCYTTTELH